MKLILIDINESQYDYEALLHSFDDEVINRINRFMLLDDRKRTLLGLALIRKYIPGGKIKYGKHGKPYKDGNVFFNVSHSKSLVGILISEKVEVGLDIEYCDPNRKEGLDEFVFGEKLDSLDFYSRWTIKESIGKCLGIGLGKDYKDIPSIEGENIYLGKKIFSQSFQFDDYMIALSNEGNKEEFGLEILETI